MALTDRPRARRRAGFGRRRRADAVDEGDGAPRAAAPGAGARAAVAAGAGTLLIARLIRLVVSVVVVIIVLAIAFVVLDANATNTIVSHVHDWAKTLVGPFDGIFSVSSAKGTIALNWGLAALVYAIIGGIIAAFVARAGLAARRAP